MEEKSLLHISAKTFILTLSILLVIILFAGILTQIVPQGCFTYIEQDGRQVIQAGTYQVIEGERLSIYRWLTAPVEVLFSDDGIVAIMIIVFLLLIGGTFQVLDQSKVFAYIVTAIIRKYSSRKYTLMAVIVFICMLMGSCVGIFEESVPLIPITVALALSLGWDSLMGLGISILSVGFGFASGTFNPFTVGIPQNLSSLPLFSGILFRIIVFAVSYVVLLLFLMSYAKKVEKDPKKSLTFDMDLKIRDKYVGNVDYGILENRNLKIGTRIFSISLALIFLYIISSLFIPALSDYTMPVMTVILTIGGLFAARAAGLKGKMIKNFGSGLTAIAPGVLLILLAMSAKQILSEGKIMDTILNAAYSFIGGKSPYIAALYIFAFVLFLQFFISSASAKAFLVMPIILPLVDLIGLTRQTAVQAFVFGDGFSDMIFPTSAVLLISLGLVGIPYTKWLKWTWKLQLVMALVSVLFLILAVSIKYGPF